MPLWRVIGVNNREGPKKGGVTNAQWGVFFDGLGCLRTDIVEDVDDVGRWFDDLPMGWDISVIQGLFFNRGRG